MSVTGHRISGSLFAGLAAFGVRAALAAALLAVCAAQAFSSGTPAGTLIQTRSKAVYSTVNRSQIDTSYSGLVTVAVVQSAAVNILPASSVKTAGGGGTATDFALTVINSGNGTDRFLLNAQSSKGWPAALYLDANGDGSLQSDEVTAGPVTQTPSMQQDASCRLVLRVSIPAGQPMNGQKETTLVRAQSVFTPSRSALGTYSTVIQSAALSGALGVNNPMPGQGSTLVFNCSFTNTGSARAENVVISNLIMSGFTYVTATGGVVNSTMNPVTWTVGGLDPGKGATVLLTVRVNNTVVPGTILAAQMTASYTSPEGSFASATNIVQVTVQPASQYGAAIVPLFTTSAGECTDTIVYRYRVMNTGNTKDGIRVRSSSSNNYMWNLYRDENNDGRWNAGDLPLAGGNTGAGALIDSLAVGDSVRIFAVAILPRVVKDQTKDTLRVTAASAGGGASDEAAVVTTINVPNIVVAKSIFPSGNHPSGSELTYTIAYSNTGHAAVENFAVVDTAPEFTEYVTNSIKVDGIAAFDNEGSVKVTTDAQKKTVITVSVGKLSSSKNGSVEFKVKVK